MAGHSKWNNIKRKKGLNDKRRGRLWSKLARNIIVAARSGGGDPSANLTLRYAIDKAKEANMPADTIDRAIKRGTGELGGAEFQPAVYEGYGPNGVAFIVDVLTDNPTRTAPEMKKLFERGGGSLGSTNCVSWNFTTRGVFVVSASAADEEKLFEIAVEAGAEDVTRKDDIFEITCDATAFHAVRSALEAGKVPVESADIAKIPGTMVTIDDAELADRLLKLVDAFEDHDDVQNVYSNFDMPDEVMAKLL